MQTNPGNMKSEALCSTHAAHVNLNIWIQRVLQYKNPNKLPTLSMLPFLPFLDVSNDAVSLMCWPAHEPQQRQELDVWQLATVPAVIDWCHFHHLAPLGCVAPTATRD